MKKIRWFLAEALVVVTGVIAAFILNSWWQDVKELRQEKEYIAQVSRELDSTIAQIRDNSELLAENTRHCAQLVSYSYAGELPADTIVMQDIFGSLRLQTTGQLSGTIKSMITTGDIGKISNKNLRIELVRLEDNFHSFEELMIRLSYDKFYPHREEVMKRLSIYDLIVFNASPDLLEGMRADSLSPFSDSLSIETPSRPDLDAIFKDPDFRNTLVQFYLASDNLLGMQRGFLASIEHTRDSIREEMNNWEKS